MTTHEANEERASPMTGSASECNDGARPTSTWPYGHVQFPSPAVSVELTRIELRRGWRWLRTQDFWQLYGVLSAIGVVFATVQSYTFMLKLGSAFDAGVPTAGLIDQFVFLCGVLWLFFVVMFTLDAFGSNGDLTHDGQYLTIVRLPDLVGGKLLASVCKFAVLLCPPIVGGYLGLSVGSGSLLPVVGGICGIVVVLSTGVAVGYPIGLALKGVVHRSTLLSRLKPVVGVLLATAYVGTVVTGDFVAAIAALESVLSGPPFTWLGALGLSTTPDATVRPLSAATAIGVSGVVVLGGLTIAPTAARFAWRATPVHPPRSDSSSSSVPQSRLDAVVGLVSQTPATMAIASTTLRRVYRAPSQLVFVAYPLIGAIPMAEQLYSSGTLPWFTPWLVVWYCAWAASVAIPLNPLGNQGATLPAVLSAPVTGHQLVRGHLLAALLPTAPVAIVLTVASGLIAGRSGAQLSLLAVVTVGALFITSVFAIGIGSAFPRFEHVDFGGSRRAVPPSKVAYGSLSTLVSVQGMAVATVSDDAVAQLFSVQLSQWLPFDILVSAGQLTLLASLAIGCGILGVGCAYLFAVRRLGAYTIA
ncbi:hypothetical protein [Halocatena halophila]|uniref:hypothetical protein n=1 Tax=Halocatena halophila TaxID=2814576 RepID=UPI002ED084D1